MHRLGLRAGGTGPVESAGVSLNHRSDYNADLRQWLQDNFRVAAALSESPLESRACPVCGAVEHRGFANNGYFDYVRCGGCALVFMNPCYELARVKGGFCGADELLMRYFRMMVRYKGVSDDRRTDPATDEKLSDIWAYKQSGRLLDVGCSVGDFLRKARHFFEVEGVEVNPQTAAVAAGQFLVHRDYLDALKLPPVYDVVTLHQILYGVPDPVSLLREIEAILAPDGIVYVNTPNADSYAMATFGGRTNHLYGYTGLNVFCRQSLDRAASAAGLEVVSFRTEWLDIYYADLMAFADDPASFIHKRNTHRPGYEESIRREEQLQKGLYSDLGNRGNYLVAVLRRKA